MRTLHIQDKSGDTQVDLDVNFDLAVELFQKAIDNGALAYAYLPNETKPVATRDISDLELATKVVVAPRQVGG